MTIQNANCPNCGGGITIRPGTVVVVCGYCSSVVARADRGLEIHGKVAALVQTQTPFEVGAAGRYQGDSFAIVGRTQLHHAAGGVWDEWYLAFDDGRWGWLAEAQGRFYLTFESGATRPLPALSNLALGSSVDLGKGGVAIVQELGAATLLAAEGELPYPFELGKTYEYADISWVRGSFATIDYSDERPTLFVGREIQFDDLGVKARDGYHSKTQISTTALNCPHCAGPLELRVPDQSLRVTCPNCGSLLDASQGNLVYLQALPQVNLTIHIPPGTEGFLQGISYTCIGYMRRSCTVEGIRYPWSEYLLYNHKIGFRWLVESDGHWSFAVPLSAGDIQRESGLVSRYAHYKGKSFKKFQEVLAIVEQIRGEFYWRVTLNETVQSADYVAGGEMLSLEISQSYGVQSRIRADELNWSLGTYLEGKEIWAGFKLPGNPPTARGISPNQPSPYKKHFADLMPLSFVFLMAVFVLFLVGSVGQSRLFYATYKVPLTPDEHGQQVTFSEPFVIRESRSPIQIRLRSDIANSWIGIDGALVGEETGALSEFYVEASYYYGNDGGAWSEGSRSASDFIAALPSGSYVLRLAPNWDKSRPPTNFEIEVRSGGIRSLYPILCLVAVLAGPAILLILHFYFENKRWLESMYSGGSES